MRERMKIAQVVPSVEEIGGVSYTVPLVCRALGNLGHEVRLHLLGPTKPRPDEPYEIVPYHWCDILKRLGISPAMDKALRAEAQRVDIMHNNSLWMMPNVYAGWAVKRTFCKLVISPHGTMAPHALERSYWQKRLFWHGFQAQAMRRAAAFHATSEAECAHIRRAGFRQPVMIIPNPLIEIPKNWTRSYTSARRLLYLGRLHPIKGLDLLLRAWAALQREFPDWHLDIAGPDNDGYVEELKRLADELGAARVSFPGAVFGADKDALYAQSDLCILPSHTENFGITVAEGLARQVPAIATHGTPWQALEEHECGWWIPIGVAPLRDCLREAFQTPRAALEEMGTRGQAWMRDTLSIEKIGAMTHEAYEWLLKGGTRPGHVVTG